MTLLTKKNIFIGFILSLLAVLALAYFWLNPFGKKNKDAWKLIPGEPVAVVETEDFWGLYKDLQQNQLWKNLQTVSYFNTVSDRLEYILLNLGNQINPILFSKDKTFTLSVHFTSKGSLDALFYVPVESNEDKEVIESVVKKFKKNPLYSFVTRSVRNIKIHEAIHSESEIRFTYFYHNRFFIGSFSTLLIEDVVRKIDGGNVKIAFRREQIPPMAKAKLPNRLSFYLNPAKFPALFQLLADEKTQDYVKPLENFSSLLRLNATALNEPLVLEGEVSHQKKDSLSFLNLFKNQRPQLFSLQSLAPLNTAALYQLSFHDPTQFHQKLQVYQRNYPVQAALKGSQEKQQSSLYSFNFIEKVEREFALCILNSEENGISNKLLFFRLKNASSDVKTLNFLSEALAKSQKKQITTEKYGAYPIREIPVNEFPEKFLGNLGKGFPQCFYTWFNQQLILANNLKTLKSWIDQYKENQTWFGQSPEIQQTFEQAANFSLVLDVDNLWEILYNNASDYFKDWMNTYENQIRSLRSIHISFTQKEQQTFTRWVFHKKSKGSVETKDAKEFEVITQANLSTAIYSQPFMVKNHTDQSREILVQDFKNKLCLLNEKGQLLWKREIGSPLRSHPEQIDIYSNERLQYLFITADRIQLIDRVSRNVPGFPIFIPDTTYLQYFTPVEFEKGKFHFLVADIKGSLYLMDSKKNMHPAWRPKRLNYRLGSAPQYFSIKGKDYFLVAQENGNVHIFEKEGQIIAGFPIKLNGKLNSPLFIAQGAEESKQFFYAITEDGRFFQFNLLGEIIRDEQLFRTSEKGTFSLIRDKQQKDWLIALTEPGYIALFNKNLERIFEKTFEGNNEKYEIQYFKLENEKKILAVTKLLESRSQLFYLNGKEIGGPIKSNKKIDLLYLPEQKKLLIYRTFGNTIGVLSIKLDD